MTIPFYVAPEQVMKDRAEYAQKGIARGRSLLATVYEGGILILSENSSRTLHKISEIYDRIAFAGVGKYNEFDQLRVAGIRHADVRGYVYSREDVDGRSLANVYAQYLGQVFTHEIKPLEVELLVAQVGDEPRDDALYHVSYDGTVIDERRYVVLGGEASRISERFESVFRPDWELKEAFIAAMNALAGEDRDLPMDELEVAVLERTRRPRAFRRVENAELEGLYRAWRETRGGQRSSTNREGDSGQSGG